jgi:2-amino-4-hydroxy-6-hydroxymethyldihydropteridine diphosphokinase
MICYLGIGSNLGDRLFNCREALKALGDLSGTGIRTVSSLYETEPVCSQGPWFINGVVEITTALSPEKLLESCQQIEGILGRIRPCPSGSPRPMDLDILLYGESVIHLPKLDIPHPRMHERGFVLIPLCEIAPNGWHPVLKETIAEMTAHVQDAHRVKRIGPAPFLSTHCRS